MRFSTADFILFGAGNPPIRTARAAFPERGKRLTRRRVRGCNSALFSSGQTNETHLSAVQGSPQAHPRISRAHAHPWRTGSIARATRQGALTVGRLSGAGQATLPRSVRLLRREEYRAALAAGTSGVRRHFTVFARPNGLGQARIGIIVSRRVAQRAVDRNRAKRLVREAFRKARHRLGGMDLVVELRRCPPPRAMVVAGAEISRLLDELSAGQRAG